MERMRLLLCSTLLLALGLLPARAADSVDIYWIDVEGGAATLIVTQAGETVLMDAGFAGFGGRDLGRIQKAMADAGSDRIDYFITSHFHGDHVGGLAPLAAKVPIGRFVDHGDSVEKDTEAGKRVWDLYLKTVGDKRQIVIPGDTLPLQGGVELMVVAAHSRFIPPPGDSPANMLCNNVEIQPEDQGENGKSTGYILRTGDFEFVNLGDLSWNYQYQLGCPTNALGEIDLFQVPHHGVRNDVSPQLIGALRPAVTVMSNGPTKGGGAEAIEVVLGTAGLEDLWQTHRAVNNDDAHNTSERLTANLGETEGCEGHWIHARVNADSSYTVTNERNGYSKTYKAKK
jgi:beta-lactamase superfamily II metal-dependent hydrolase